MTFSGDYSRHGFITPSVASLVATITLYLVATLVAANTKMLL